MTRDSLRTQVQRAQATFTAAVQQAFGAASPQELVALLADGAPKKRKHWTQTPAWRKAMAARAKGNQHRKGKGKGGRTPAAAFVKSAGKATVFAVNTVRAAQGAMPREDLLAALTANGYKKTALGALVRYRYLKLTREGYALGAAAKRVQA